MAIKLIPIIKTVHDNKLCMVCKKDFEGQTKILSKETCRGLNGGGKRAYYHIKCARQKNIIVPDMWWNRLAKYKRYEYLLSQELEQDDIQEYSQFSYNKLPEEIKLLIDIFNSN